jgi:hypothetical protein
MILGLVDKRAVGRIIDHYLAGALTELKPVLFEELKLNADVAIIVSSRSAHLEKFRSAI